MPDGYGGGFVGFNITSDGGEEVSCENARETMHSASFPIGITTVTCTASDAAGNVGTMIFTVTVLEASADTTPADTSTGPIITVPSDITVTTTDPAGAVVSFTVTATSVGYPLGNLGCYNFKDSYQDASFSVKSLVEINNNLN